MFMGEFHHNLDDKSRLVIPNTLRTNLGNNFIITMGLEKCLYIYPNNEFDKLKDKLTNLPFYKNNSRVITRFVFSRATCESLDSQGRIVIPKSLQNYANLEKECIILGVNERIEIWQKDLYESYLEENLDKISEIAEDLYTGDNT